VSHVLPAECLDQRSLPGNLIDYLVDFFGQSIQRVRHDIHAKHAYCHVAMAADPAIQLLTTQHMARKLQQRELIRGVQITHFTGPLVRITQ